MIHLKKAIQRLSVALEMPGTLPKVLYHATFGVNEDLIREYGLLPHTRFKDLPAEFELTIAYPGREDGVYLADSPALAESMVENAENIDQIPEDWLGDIVVFEINVDMLDKNKLKIDPHYSGMSDDPRVHSYIYKGRINPSAISSAY